MTPLEQYRAVRRAVQLSHEALAQIIYVPSSVGSMMMLEVAKAMHSASHNMLRRARRRLVLSALANIVSSLAGLITVWLMLLGAIYIFEKITNR